jgi:predicted ATPase
LRFLALTLLAYLGEPGFYIIEEPENGIHPKALEAVYQSLSSIYEGQVFCATHSPIFLNLARPVELLCFVRTESGATDIVRGDQHPALAAWKEEVTLGDLLASGVLG